jgi:hypothetical protein
VVCLEPAQDFAVLAVNYKKRELRFRPWSYQQSVLFRFMLAPYRRASKLEETLPHATVRKVTSILELQGLCCEAFAKVAVFAVGQINE